MLGLQQQNQQKLTKTPVFWLSFKRRLEEEEKYEKKAEVFILKNSLSK
jgi:hypothetical protein